MTAAVTREVGGRKGAALAAPSSAGAWPRVTTFLYPHAG